jgi:hypothetical protein
VRDQFSVLFYDDKIIDFNFIKRHLFEIENIIFVKKRFHADAGGAEGELVGFQQQVDNFLHKLF